MNLIQRISNYPLESVRSKRKKRYWLLIWLVSTFAACDVLLLFLLTKIFLPHLLSNTPYLLPEQAQEYTHLSTFTPSPERSVNMLAFTPDGKTLACAVYNEIILWDVKTDVPLYTIKELEGVVTALAFAPDGKTLAISNQSKQNSVILYDTATGHLKTYLTGHTSWIATLDFSPDGETLVGANSDGLITAWDTSTGLTHQRKLGTLAFTQADYLYRYRYYAYDRERIITRLSNSEAQVILRNSYCRERIITRWHWDVRDLNVGNTPENLNSILNSKTFVNKEIIVLTPGPNLLPIYLSYPVQVLEFSPDGKILASGSRSDYQLFNITTGKIHLWDVDTGQTVATLKTPGMRVDTLAFSPDGKTLASDGNKHWKSDNKIFIWDLTTYELISIIETDSPSKITALAFAPDNITLASSNSSGRVDLWDITGNIKNR